MFAIRYRAIVFALLSCVALSSPYTRATSKPVKRHLLIGIDVSESIKESEAIAALSSLKSLLTANDDVRIYFFAEGVYRFEMNPVDWDSASSFCANLLRPDTLKDAMTLRIAKTWIKSQKKSDHGQLLRFIMQDVGGDHLTADVADNIAIMVISDNKYKPSRAYAASLDSLLKASRFITVSVDGEKKQKPSYLVFLEIASTDSFYTPAEKEKYQAPTIKKAEKIFKRFFIHKKFRNPGWHEFLTILGEPLFIGIELLPEFLSTKNGAFAKFLAHIHSPFLDEAQLDYYIGFDTVDSKGVLTVKGDDHRTVELGSLRYVDGKASCFLHIESHIQPRKNNGFIFPVGKMDSTKITIELLRLEKLVKDAHVKYFFKRQSHDFYLNPNNVTAQLPFSFVNQTGCQVTISYKYKIISDDHRQVFDLDLEPRPFDIKVTDSEKSVQRFINLNLFEKKTNWRRFLETRKISALIQFDSATDKTRRIFTVTSDEDAHERGVFINIVVPSLVLWWFYSLFEFFWIGVYWALGFSIVGAIGVTLIRSYCIKYLSAQNLNPLWEQWIQRMRILLYPSLFIVGVYCLGNYLCYDLLTNNIESSASTFERSALKAVLFYMATLLITLRDDVKFLRLLGYIVVSVLVVLLDIL